MALLALGAVLEGEVDYQIVDGNLCDASGLERAVVSTGSRLVAMTVMGGPQLRHAVEAASRLKMVDSSIVIIWGGYFPTQHPEACIGSGLVDFVVIGHGELVFRDILRHLLAGCRVDEMDGVVSSASTRIRRAPIPDPDKLPSFPYHRVPIERYVRSTFLGRRTLPHHSSYGCPFQCNFCAVVNMVSGRWFARSAERTGEDVRHLVEKFDVDAVELYDNNFFVHEARTRAFADHIRDLGISWWGEARVDTLLRYGDTTWSAMRASGLRMVFLGAESGSNETLRRMNKGGSASAAGTLHLAEKMKALGIIPEFSFVVGNPPDPEGDTEQTLTFIRKVKKVNPEAEIILYMYTPVPLAGELYSEATTAGFAFPETLDGWLTPAWQEFSQRRLGGNTWIRDPLRRRVRNFEYVLNAFYPTITNQRLGDLQRKMLRTAGRWRYRTGTYGFPLELRLMQRAFRYRRPETTGF